MVKLAWLVAGVVLSFYEPGYTKFIGCPTELPRIIRQSDGMYRRDRSQSGPTTLLSCERVIPEVTWQEEWTDLPERGGVFIRRIDP